MDPGGKVSPAFIQGARLTPDPKFVLVGCLDYTISYSGRRRDTKFLYDLGEFPFQENKASNVPFVKHYGRGNSAN